MKYLLVITCMLCSCSFQPKPNLHYYLEVRERFGPSEAQIYHPSEPIKALPAPQLTRTPEVQRELDAIRRTGPNYFGQALKRRGELYPTISQIFRDEGVPLELINLALIESSFKVDARSGAGAVGLWQFMKSTARIYDLEVSWLKDERKDPIISTLAAARHLRDLYSAYNDWHLALAAYNAGSYAIDRALVQSGVKDYWTLARGGYLSGQTANFVPRFIATTIVVEEQTRGLAIS